MRGRLAAAVATCLLLLFALLPTVHLATASAGHAADECPICHTLQRHGDLTFASATMGQPDQPPGLPLNLAPIPHAPCAPSHTPVSRAPPVV